jgi:sulfur carrier protein ThiS
MVEPLSDTLKEKRIQKFIVEKSKTVAQLLVDLGISNDHIVLVDGKRVSLDFQINENESVVILPRIAGG